MLTRRAFLTHTSAITASHTLFHSTSFADNGNKHLASLHNKVIQSVKQLNKGASIELTILYPKGCLANIKPLTTAFSKETGVRFTLKESGVDDINASIVFSAAKNEHTFDIALPATFGLLDLVSVGALAPLSDYAKKYEPINYKQDQLYDYGDYVNATLYGYQTDGDTYLMFYNKSMMDDTDNKKAFYDQHQYELAIPETWDQLDDMIRFFHQPQKLQYGGCLFRVPGYGAWEWWSRFHAKGYFPLNNQGEPQINNKAGVSALQEMLDISTYLHPSTASDNLFDNWDTYSQNQTFCNIGWGGSQKFFNSNKSKVKNNLYYAPAPGGNIKGRNINCPIFNWGWNYVVSSQCPHKEIAYLFTLYACSPSMSTLSVQQDGYFDPFRKEHYENPEIQAIYSPEFLDAHKLSMEQSIPDFYIQNQTRYLSSLQENIYLAYKGSLTAKQALDITATEWQRQNLKVGIEKQKQNWLSLQEKYPKTLKNSLI
ncbi:MAG: extracellular solute-binding protein [Cellvibrionaceae bacterium]